MSSSLTFDAEIHTRFYDCDIWSLDQVCCSSFCLIFWANPCVLCFQTANSTEPDFKSKDWVFLNYTYKRFEGLTQRGTIPTYMKAGKAWRSGGRGGRTSEKKLYGHRVGPRSPAGAEGHAAGLSVKLNPHPELLRSAELHKSCRSSLRSITALPRLFVSFVPYLAIALKPGH